MAPNVKVPLNFYTYVWTLVSNQPSQKLNIETWQMEEVLGKLPKKIKLNKKEPNKQNT